ncbi:MAG: cytochrome C biogenesis protein [Dehalococcoidia bacterium]|nr:cytochrome C biogenesis protein [Dehalococcoidia bacterium]
MAVDAATGRTTGDPLVAEKRRRQRRRRIILGTAALVVLAPAGTFVATRPIVGPEALSGNSAGASAGSSESVAPSVGHQAPLFEATTLDGKTVHLEDFRGQPVFVNFWATWCGPCRIEMPHIQALSQQYRDRGLVVLAISIDDLASERDVRAYIEAGSPETGSYTFPILLDAQREIAQEYKLFGLPASYFVDARGIIRASHPGAMSRDVMVEKVRSILPGA